MGRETGVWNTAPTPYDELVYDGYTSINRLTNFEAWALLNQRNQMHWNVLAPDGILYCSAPCAIIDNPQENWSEDDMEIISGKEFWKFYYGIGINPWCVDRCPHCGLSYRTDGHWPLKKKDRVSLKKRKRVQKYIKNRKPFEHYLERIRKEK